MIEFLVQELNNRKDTPTHGNFSCNSIFRSSFQNFQLIIRLNCILYIFTFDSKRKTVEKKESKPQDALALNEFYSTALLACALFTVEVHAYCASARRRHVMSCLVLYFFSFTWVGLSE